MDEVFPEPVPRITGSLAEMPVFPLPFFKIEEDLSVVHEPDIAVGVKQHLGPVVGGRDLFERSRPGILNAHISEETDVLSQRGPAAEVQGGSFSMRTEIQGLKHRVPGYIVGSEYSGDEIRNPGREHTGVAQAEEGFYIIPVESQVKNITLPVNLKYPVFERELHVILCRRFFSPSAVRAR